MILRVAAVLMLLAGLAVFTVYLHALGKSPFSSAAARHLRTMKDRSSAPDSMGDTTYEAMAAMPRGLSVAEYSGHEMRAVRLEGYVQRMVRAADDDIHLELAPVPRMPGDPNVGYVTAEITPAWHRGSRAWSHPRLVEAFRPSYGGRTAWERGTRRVRLTGWLLNDYEYAGSPSGRGRLTSWEIHPVTRIELWEDSRDAFVEYPR